MEGRSSSGRGFKRIGKTVRPEVLSVQVAFDRLGGPFSRGHGLDDAPRSGRVFAAGKDPLDRCFQRHGIGREAAPPGPHAAVLKQIGAHRLADRHDDLVGVDGFQIVFIVERG